jgi:hypothetical protein
MKSPGIGAFVCKVFWNYMISIASAKKVTTNGRARVSISPLKTNSRKKAATDAKNNSQYKPFDLFWVSMSKNLCENKG